MPKASHSWDTVNKILSGQSFQVLTFSIYAKFVVKYSSGGGLVTFAEEILTRTWANRKHDYWGLERPPLIYTKTSFVIRSQC